MAAKSKIKKLFTALWITLAGVPLLLIAAITIVLSSETAQTYVAEKVASHLSEKSGAQKKFVMVNLQDIFMCQVEQCSL